MEVENIAIHRIPGKFEGIPGWLSDKSVGKIDVCLEYIFLTATLFIYLLVCAYAFVALPFSLAQQKSGGNGQILRYIDPF